MNFVLHLQMMMNVKVIHVKMEEPVWITSTCMSAVVLWAMKASTVRQVILNYVIWHGFVGIIIC